MAENGDLVDLEAPEIIAMVKHDGADTCIAARLEGNDASVGMKVEAVIDTGAANVLDLPSRPTSRWDEGGDNMDKEVAIIAYAQTPYRLDSENSRELHGAGGHQARRSRPPA